MNVVSRSKELLLETIFLMFFIKGSFPVYSCAVLFALETMLVLSYFVRTSCKMIRLTTAWQIAELYLFICVLLPHFLLKKILN